ASLRAQTVMVPWWQVAQPRSARHLIVSFTRNDKPLSIACWGFREADVAVGALFEAPSGFFGSCAPATLTPLAERSSAAIANNRIHRACIVAVLLPLRT